MVSHVTTNIHGERQITHTKVNKKGFTVALASHGNGGKLQKVVDGVESNEEDAMILDDFDSFDD